MNINCQMTLSELSKHPDVRLIDFRPHLIASVFKAQNVRVGLSCKTTEGHGCLVSTNSFNSFVFHF